MEHASIQSDFAARPGRTLRVTQRRVDANRRNAMRSTGPRTPEGKAKVRLNALRHGFRARDETCIAVGGDDTRREIEAHIEKLSREIHPRGPEQDAAVSALAHALWKLGRAHQMSERSRWWQVREDPREQRENLRFFAGMIRYEARAYRELHRALDAVRQIQRARIRENERSNPLARRSQASGPERSEGPQPRPDRWLTLALPANVENERTNPLAVAPNRESAPTLSELTFRFWDEERGRRCNAIRK